MNVLTEPGHSQLDVPSVGERKQNKTTKSKNWIKFKMHTVQETGFKQCSLLDLFFYDCCISYKNNLYNIFTICNSKSGSSYLSVVDYICDCKIMFL